MNPAEEILSLMRSYCDTIDRGDLAGCAALFAQGAWGIAGDLAHGRDAVLEVLNNVILYEGVPNTRHLMSNVQITIDDSGLSGRAESCITVMQVVPEALPLQAIFVGSYADRFEKSDQGSWRFRERVITPDLVGDLSFHRSDMASD